MKEEWKKKNLTAGPSPQYNWVLLNLANELTWHIPATGE